MPIVGAEVLITNSNATTTTDENGRFNIQTNSQKTELIITHIGYKTKQINVINEAPISITMRHHTYELQCAVVLGKQNEILDLPFKKPTNEAKMPICEKIGYTFSEKNVEYIGGTSELYSYLKNNLRYPKEAQENNKEGVIYTQFIVNEKGEISEVKIVNPLGYMGFVGYGLEAEAKRVVSKMPNWLPAIQNGRAESTYFTLPIQFILDEAAPKNKNSLNKKTSGSLIKIGENNLEGLSVFHLKDTIKKQENETFGPVEEGAQFPGGIKKMQEFIRMNLRYPKQAQFANVQGKVFLSFIVAKTGEITDIQILKGLGFGMDEEAIRIVKLMPKWTPTKISGKDVVSRYNLPISFKLHLNNK